METEASVAPFMVDFERLFSSNPKEQAEPCYVAYKDTRYYGRDPTAVALTLRSQIGKTTRINSAYRNSRNPNAQNLLVASGPSAMNNIRSGFGSLGRGLFRGTRSALRSTAAGLGAAGRATASGLGAAGRATARATRSARNYAFKPQIDEETGEVGQSRVGRLGSSITSGAKAVGSAAATGAKAVGSAAATGAKAVGSAAATGAKRSRNYLFKEQVDEETGEVGQSRVGRLGSAATTGAKVVGSAATTGAKVVGSAATTGAKVVGSAATTGLKSAYTGAKTVGSIGLGAAKTGISKIRSAFNRTNTRKVRPGSVANTMKPNNTRRVPRPGSAASLNVSSA